MPNLLVVNEEIFKRIPLVGVMIQIGHGRLQARLQRMLMILEEPEDSAPYGCRKPWKHLMLRLWNDSVFLGNPGQSKQYSRQQIHVDLIKFKIFLKKRPQSSHD